MLSKTTIVFSIGVALAVLAQSHMQPANAATRLADVQASPLAPTADVGSGIAIQGRLTATSGAPINGNVNLVATLYDASTGGVARCTSTANAVAVSNGLFDMVLFNCSTNDIDGDALWLGIKVNADAEMTPRSPIRAVPYALALRPGAKIRGADSYVFVAGNTAIKNVSTDSTVLDALPNGSTSISRGGTSGNKVVYFPITLPGVLYGQDTRISRVEITYKTTSSVNAYINETRMSRQNSDMTSSAFINSAIDQTSTIPDTYAPTIESSAAGQLSGTQGTMGLYLTLGFNNATDKVEIGNIRLTLSHR